MIRKPITWLTIMIGSVLAFMEISQAIAMGSVGSISRYVTKGVKNQAPKHADDLPSSKGSTKSIEDELGLNGPLVSRSLARAHHNRTCPTTRLRVSLPQLNAQVLVPEKLNIRSGPGTNYSPITYFRTADSYTLDLLSTQGCWVQIRFMVRSRQHKGWVYSKLLNFTFDDHLTKPQKRLTRNLDASGVYRLVARSTYKIGTPTGTGSAVAISPTVLLTNCHVLGNNKTVQILESGKGYKANLIHAEYSKDKCFIRSLELEVKPIAHVKSFSRIQKGEQAYSVGAPLGHNRSFGKGVVFKGQQRSGDRWILATTPIDFGSSGGGLFGILQSNPLLWYIGPPIISLIAMAFVSPNYVPASWFLDVHKSVKEPKNGEFAGFSLKRGVATLGMFWFGGIMFSISITLMAMGIAIVIDIFGFSCILPANALIPACL